MNASGWVLAALLLVVLLAVVWGANQTEDSQQNLIQQLTQQRDQAMIMAQEAKAQRDDIAGEMALLKGRMGDLQAGLQQKEAEIAAINSQLAEANKLTGDQTARIQLLEAQNASLQQQVKTEIARSQEMDRLIVAMNGQLSEASKVTNQQAARVKELEAQSANASLSIPVTAGNGQPSGDQPGQTLPNCRTVSLIGFGLPLTTGLAVLMGMVTLGGSGYVFYHGKSHPGL